jgi:hypothetical protein
LYEPDARSKRIEPIGISVGVDEEAIGSAVKIDWRADRKGHGAPTDRAVQVNGTEIGLDAQQPVAALPVVTCLCASGKPVGFMLCAPPAATAAISAGAER